MGWALRRTTAYIVVFFGSLGVMIIELVASRLVAKYLGNSLYTWTGVIGVVLGGISLGNYAGGRVADRYSPPRAIVPVLLLSAAATLSILLLDTLLDRFMGARGVTGGYGFILRSVGLIALLFLLPSASLGAISPIMAKYALLEHAMVGRTVGTIYAVSSIGSIAGTFAAGFILIPLLDLRLVVAIVGFTIAALALLVPGRRLVAGAGTLLFACVGLFALFADRTLASTGGRLLYARYSQYSYIQVKDLADEGSPTGERVLIMDGLIHNRFDLEDPDRLLYEYEAIFEAASRAVAPTPEARRKLHTLTLGGGAMTLPSYLARNYAPAENRVVEIDPRVVSIARRYFAVPKEHGPEVTIGDARLVARSLSRGHTYDIVYLDAFNSFAVPYHLTTVEFTRLLARLLSPDGILLVNTIDILDSGAFLAGYEETLRSVFPQVRVYADGTMNPHERSTFVLWASKSRLAPEVLATPVGTPIAFALDRHLLDEAVERNRSRPFSDYYAPVDNLMAPVFLRAVR